MKREKKESKVVTAFLLSVIASLLFLFGFIYQYRNLIEPVIVSGTSMSPTLKQDEKLLIYKTTNLKYGDIVSFKAPDETDKYYIKRVIGVAGDTVEYKDGVLYINGEKKEESYLDSLRTELTNEHSNQKVTEDFTLKTLQSTASEKVPEGYIFVMGDNRPDSKDSRYFGFISVESVIGKMVYPKTVNN